MGSKKIVATTYRVVATGKLLRALKKSLRVVVTSKSLRALKEIVTAVKKALRLWNKSVFGNVEDNMLRLEDEIRVKQDNFDNTPTP
ncbi:hypothetical protein Taro_000128, partial [Colocasia esculenta]|nr:hypothetical protein [Colocasia esculenta]